MFIPRTAKAWLRRLRHSKPRRPLPTLPPEVWILILRFATDDAGALAGPHAHLHAPVSFLNADADSSDLLRRLTIYRRSLACKTALARVCKDWQWMSQELLYDFVWISRAAQAKALAATVSDNNHLGAIIRRLHIETPTLERCDPAHLRTIIDHSPRLAAYSDYRSIRRQPHSSPDHLLSSLARPGNKLKRLSWTNYDYDRRDQSGCISFFLHLSPALGMAASELDYLELSLCATDLVSPNVFQNSVVSAYTSSQGSKPVHLPALRTLKLTLDNITFSVLSQWSMPALKNISVLSTDFSYTGSGFARFFQVHGANIVQLELGHSTGAIEEHYLTTPPLSPHTHPHTRPSSNLASWCPNLREFICSADAEWHWQSPDWIAPHLLLPSHPNLQLIGIRDMNKRLLDDLDLYLVRHAERSTTPGTSGPFFRLAEQMRSLLRSEAFPNLQVVRDMSWESAFMRKCERMPVPEHPLRFDVWDTLPDSVGEEKDFGKALVSFWRAVKQRCAARGVCLQDWTGEPVVL
ncbi:hypothetical protein P691DRAFT_806964 [Macrolepiota fuliginosa MF-IS2]|uniref:F-box domain-containing protein n=1 Tax=Macrolepiota fuliginosa MF-IS2 TaxID=1400762 RepID=A0A9P5X7B9_9AGAR|nr:hypothetical protein P691DRAFT_806964 [Macrolepiota fuliginosa MF-IS2]